MQWRASEYSIRESVVNAIKLAEKLQIKSLAFPLLGTGSGVFDSEKAETIMCATLEMLDSPVEVTLVRFHRRIR